MERPQPNRSTRIAGVVLAASLVALGVWLLSGRGDAPEGGNGSEDAAALIAAVCEDVPPDMMIRTDAFASAGRAVAGDAQALADQGFAAEAQDASELAGLLQAISDANEAQEDTAALFDEFLTKFHDFGC
ncbi:MAG: hypothetical protein WD096_07635 [Actinomycetota bacterium]